MEKPTLDELATQLQDVSGVDAVDVDAALLQLSDIDSLDLTEWLYNFQTTYPDIPVDESLFADVDDTTTLRHLHERILALVPPVPQS